ncbi:ABC transporter ATP-binding protein [Pseudomonas sp. MT3]
MADDSTSVIRTDRLGKMFHIFERPGLRFLHALLGERFGFHREFWALRDISFDLARGEVLGVIGRNGSGKSTLLQMLAGTVSPSVGTVTRLGRIAALLELGTGFDPEETGRRNIEFTARLLGLSSEELALRQESIIEFAEVGEFIDQPVKTYSSGMVVRLAFAITAHVDADIVIVDEALAVGDAQFQFKCLNRLDQLLERGVTVVLVSHDLQLIKAYCNRVIYLKGGLVQFDGDCETGCELYLRDTTPATRAVSAGSLESRQDILAFGNGHGRIQSAVLVGDGAERGYFVSGERVSLDVSLQLFEPVRCPRITLVLRDARGYNLYAVNNSQLGLTLVVDSSGLIRVRFSFVADLQDGDYALTLRLDDALSEKVQVLLDKRVGVLSFRVESPRKRFDAVVNLHGSAEVLPA